MKTKLEKFIGISSKKRILGLAVIMIIGVFLRIYYFPFDIPVHMDALMYFKYGLDVSILGDLPQQFLVNNGWPIFLSLFFSIPFSENFMDYMTLQKMLTVTVSVLTAIPVYFLCKKFFDHRISLVGATLFLFEPKILQNSLTGITEPLYVLLMTISMALFLHKEKYQYIAFSVVSLSTLVRYEGVVLLFAFIIIYLINNRKKKKNYLKCLPMIGIFFLVMAPMTISQMEQFGQDGVASHVIAGGEVFSRESTSHSESIFGPMYFISESLAQLGKFIFYSLIPTFIIFVPLGVLLFFRKKFEQKTFLILTVLFLIIPAFYAYSRGIQEVRYLFVLYPIFCVIAVVPINEIFQKMSRKNTILFLIILAGVLSTSIIFLEINNIDNEHEREAYEISKKVVEMTTRVNSYYPESKYVRTAEMHKETLVEISNKESLYEFDIGHNPKEYTELHDFVVTEELTHLVIDDSEDRPKFLREVFDNEEKYSYLSKIYDSKNDGFDYHVKIFEIDYIK